MATCPRTFFARSASLPQLIWNLEDPLPSIRSIAEGRRPVISANASFFVAKGLPFGAALSLLLYDVWCIDSLSVLPRLESLLSILLHNPNANVEVPGHQRRHKEGLAGMPAQE